LDIFLDYVGGLLNCLMIDELGEERIFPWLLLGYFVVLLNSLMMFAIALESEVPYGVSNTSITRDSCSF